MILVLILSNTHGSDVTHGSDAFTYINHVLSNPHGSDVTDALASAQDRLSKLSNPHGSDVTYNSSCYSRD